MINYVDLNQIDVSNQKVLTKDSTDKKLYISYDYKFKKWVAVDNTSNDFFMEDFNKLDDAILWLRNINFNKEGG